MDLRQLRYFTKVVDSGSISKAANQLNVAQPALSLHIRHMEEELGVALLYRSPNGVQATEAGLKLVLYAKRILAEFIEMGDAVRGSILPRGEVRIGLPGTVSELLAAPLIEAAMERYPDVRIRIVEAMSGYILEWLKRGDVDVAMIYSTSNPKGIAVHHGLSEEICLFAAPGYARRLGHDAGGTMSFADAASLPLVVPGPGHGLRELIEDAALVARASVDPAIEIDSYNQIKKLVSRGLGFGMLPRMAVALETEAGDFVAWTIATPPVTRKVYLAYSTERPFLTAPRAIAQLAWEILRQLVRDQVWTADLSPESERPDLLV